MKKALMVWGGWEGHEPEQCVKVFAPILEQSGFQVEISDTMDAYCDETKMQALNLIVPMWTMGTISGEQELGLLKAVRSGVGLAGWHGGMCDSFRNNTSYQFMTGGQWVAHPGNIMDYTVNIVDQRTRNHARHQRFFDALGAVLFAHRSGQITCWRPRHLAANRKICRGFKDVVMPVVWTKMWGEGRVFYSSLGHVAADFDGAEVREIQTRGMLWAAR